MDEKLRERIVKVERRRAGDVQPNLRNPKLYSAEKRERLNAIVDKSGKAGVLLSYFDDDGVERYFDGNTRSLTYPNEVWWIAQTDLTQQEVDNLVTLYDPLAGQIDWDNEILGTLLQESDETEAVLMDMLEEVADEAGLLDALNNDDWSDGEEEDAEPQISRADELQQEWQTATGQLWRLPSRDGKGEHFLVCGDCTDPDVVNQVMMGDLAVLVSTDPPYGVDFAGAKFNPRAKEWEGIAGDKRQGDELRQWFCHLCELLLNHVDKKAAWYAWAAPMREGYQIYLGLIDAGLHVQSQIIWAKNTLVLGQADYHWKHEIAWYAFLKGENHRWFGERDKTTLWEVPKVANQLYLHPNQKPTGIYDRPILNHTKKRDILLEPFSGSGTQLIAAENLGRYCRAVEISPSYVAVALQRYKDAFGIEPELVME